MTTTLDIMHGLVLEDGRAWGEVAHGFQTADVAALSDVEGPRRHFWLRGRGMSKSTDAAAWLLSALIAEAPARSRSYLFAADAEQAGLTHDQVGGLVARTAGLGGLVEVGARQVTVRSSGASMVVMSADGASAHGLRPWAQAVDEVAQWPSTRNYRTLWGAVASGVAKVPGGRLLVTTTAGSPVGLGHEVFEAAQSSEHWQLSVRPGPAPWWSEADVAATRVGLTEPEFARLVLCQWVSAEDALVDPEDVRAVLRSRPKVLAPRPGVRYVAALDVGTRRDLTALAVGHKEADRTVIDLVRYWRPTAARRVDLAEVQAGVAEVCRRYSARLVFDRHQAEQLVQGLGRAGLAVSEFLFNLQTNNELARRLYIALRDRAIELPDDDELVEQFTTTRLVERGPGLVKLDNPAGTHDDLAVAVGMVLLSLQDDGPNRKVSTAIHSRRGDGMYKGGRRVENVNRRGHPVPELGERWDESRHGNPLRGIQVERVPGSSGWSGGRGVVYDD